MSPRAAILRSAGTNCDRETEQALRLAGAETERLHLHRLVEDPARLDALSILVVAGCFSYGDDVAAGRVFGRELRHHLSAELRAFVERGGLVLGICNGFQILVEAGLFTGTEERADERDVALSANRSGNFECRWVTLRAEPCACPWLVPGELMPMPAAHAEGRFVTRDEGTLARLEARGQVALRYADANGEADHRVAGLSQRLDRRHRRHLRPDRPRARSDAAPRTPTSPPGTTPTGRASPRTGPSAPRGRAFRLLPPHGRGGRRRARVTPCEVPRRGGRPTPRNRTMIRTPALVALLALPLLSSCAAAVIGGVAGLVASQEMLDNNTYVSHVQRDVSFVWPEVKMYLSETSLDLIEPDEELRTVKARIDGADVLVAVEAWDIDNTIIRVQARKFGVNDGEMARVIMERIHQRLLDQPMR